MLDLVKEIVIFEVSSFSTKSLGSGKKSSTILIFLNLLLNVIKVKTNELYFFIPTQGGHEKSELSKQSH